MRTRCVPFDAWHLVSGDSSRVKAQLNVNRAFVTSKAHRA